MKSLRPSLALILVAPLMAEILTTSAPVGRGYLRTYLARLDRWALANRSVANWPSCWFRCSVRRASLWPRTGL